MSEQLSPERAIRILRAKAAELEHAVLAAQPIPGYDPPGYKRTPLPLEALDDGFVQLMADIALIAILLADHMERCGQDPS